jgi:iron(III) transport system permease protein
MSVAGPPAFAGPGARRLTEASDARRHAASRGLGLWLAVGWVAFAAAPWNAIAGQGFFGFTWLSAYPLGARVAPAALQLIHDGRLWLLPLPISLALATLAGAREHSGRRASTLLVAAGTLGLLNVLAVALMIDIGGWTWQPLAKVFGDLPGRQPGLGYGAAGVAAASLMFICRGVALRGWAKETRSSRARSVPRSLSSRFSRCIRSCAFWCVRCRIATETCCSPHSPRESRRRRSGGYGGVVLNSLQLGLMTALAATLLALCFALIVTRSRLPDESSPACSRCCR